MWCIVNLPNGTQQAVKLDTKAIGQECLEKVCKASGIICEMEYFGLEHWSPNQKESRTHQWINLRNRLSCDSNGSGIQLMLALRVKFWVPVHFILQESARNLFYTQAKVDLLEGRLNARNWSNAAKMAALLCQADGIRFNETSLQSKSPLLIKSEQDQQLPQGHEEQSNDQQHLHLYRYHSRYHHPNKDKDHHVLSFKKRRLSKPKSIENIDSIQNQASTSNLTINATTSNHISSSVNSAQSQVKIINTEVMPSTSSCRTTGNNCFCHQSAIPSNNINIHKNATNITINSMNACTSAKKLSKYENTEIDSISTNSPLKVYRDYIIRPWNEDPNGEIPDDFLKQIALEHGKLATLKMSSKSAKYWLLQEIQDLPGYGEEVFSGITTNEHSHTCDISVAAYGITITIGNNVSSAIAAAKSFRRSFKLEYVDDHNNRREIEMKLPRHCIAAGLYRSITERHAFYMCDKVRGVVTNQFTRDLKGTIASMFKEDTELGKRYVFDIQRTSREVHDQARRILYERGMELSPQHHTTNFYDLPHLLQEENTQHLITTSGKNYEDVNSCIISSNDSNSSHSYRTEAFNMTVTSKVDTLIREKQAREAAIERCVDTRINEAMTCKICMDRAINTMFNPCCHIMACEECAVRCESCPNCRVKSTSVVKIYLPPELRTQATINNKSQSGKSDVSHNKNSTEINNAYDSNINEENTITHNGINTRKIAAGS